MISYDHVVGLDLSLTSTGLAVIGPGKPWCATIESKGKDVEPWSVRYHRLCDLASRIIAPIPEGALVVLEAPAYSRNTGKAFDRAGLWWMVYDLLAGSTRTVLPVAPNLRAKYATGKSGASKDTVLAAAVRRYPTIDISGNDTADAVVLAAIGCRLLGKPIDDMPATHLAALDKIQLPEEVAA
jgi:crossover junction endodeoxyribonuclease RuvC